MEKINATLRGVTLSAINGRYDQLLVTMAVSECEINGKKKSFPIPSVVTVSLEPYRMIVPLNDKHALVTRGSEVEFEITNPEGVLKAKLLRVKEHETALSLEDFMASL